MPAAQAGRRLPGSPFALTVTPGAAHHSTSYVDLAGKQPLVGEIGLSDPDAGCSIVLHTADRSGNICETGGAHVTLVCSNKEVHERRGPQ